MRFKKTVFASFMISALLCQSVLASVPGWPSDRIAMGTAVNGSDYTNQLLKQRLVDSVFTYAGNNGAGDRGTLLLPNIKDNGKIINIMQQTRDLEAATGRTIRPLFVFYTIDGSDGVWAMQQDLDIGTGKNNLAIHYANLIIVCRMLEGYKDATHAVPATLLLNPDFLGELHKSCSPNWCPMPVTQAVDVQKGLTEAYQLLKDNGIDVSNVKIPDEFKQPNATLKEYVASVNWIVKTFAPDVALGWQDNIWAGDEKAHKWIHQATQKPDMIPTHIQTESDFLQQLQVFTGTYKPDFIAFDKWERDVFDSSLAGSGLNNGYLYNANDWDVYMNFVSGISKSLNNMPVMLWQIPGGHLQTLNDIDARLDHASTAPDYFLGDATLSDHLENVATYITNNHPLDPYTYGEDSENTNANGNISKVYSAATYLACDENHPGCWHKNRLKDIASNANVFAILWGGGSTTGIAGINATLDDNGWLYQQLTKS